MSWTASITKDPVKSADSLTVSIEYQVTDGQTVIGPIPATVSLVDSIWQILLDAENQLNRKDAQQSAISDFDPKSVTGKTAAELKQEYDDRNTRVVTQDELDLAAFRNALQSYLNLRTTYLTAQTASLATTVKLQDVMAAYVAWKQTYGVNPDKFGPMNPVPFPPVPLT